MFFTFTIKTFLILLEMKNNMSCSDGSPACTYYNMLHKECVDGESHCQ